MEQTLILLNESKLKRRRMINKLFLGFFLSIAIIAFIMKMIDGVLLDLGWNFDGKIGIHTGFWMHGENYSNTNGGPLDPNNQNYSANEAMLSHHPSMLWLLTQFTWITTIIIIVFLTFRFFKYDATLPRWLKWIMTQRTLSLIAMYDAIVSIVFWVGMFNSFDESFNGSLREFELTITILVHAIVPLFMLCYSLLYLIRDKNASILREMFVIKGMIYPTIYIAYYVLISIVWSDPYAITHIHKNITENKIWVSQIWVVVVALIGIWSLLGFMILFHNIVLLKFNKKYDPKNDHEIKKRKQNKIEKIQRRIIRKYARKGLEQNKD